MAYTDDWESLMNGVFGAGGKLKFGGAQPQPEKPQPEKPAGSGLPDLNAALLEQQKRLDEIKFAMHHIKDLHSFCSI